MIDQISPWVSEDVLTNTELHLIWVKFLNLFFLFLTAGKTRFINQSSPPTYKDDDGLDAFSRKKGPRVIRTSVQHTLLNLGLGILEKKVLLVSLVLGGISTDQSPVSAFNVSILGWLMLEKIFLGRVKLRI